LLAVTELSKKIMTSVFPRDASLKSKWPKLTILTNGRQALLVFLLLPNDQLPAVTAQILDHFQKSLGEYAFWPQLTWL
jgi:hypothetical protein